LTSFITADLAMNPWPLIEPRSTTGGDGGCGAVGAVADGEAPHAGANKIVIRVEDRMRYP
jgi:hypothetical protein